MRLDYFMNKASSDAGGSMKLSLKVQYVFISANNQIKIRIVMLLYLIRNLFFSSPERTNQTLALDLGRFVFFFYGHRFSHADSMV